ncbi:unnamed protein product [Clonostachys solani]|uniref:Uncharacterized protein n=1 Tax=Clonostachys solani TaxID=160281 RepID=A0A9N9Z6V0_9HYPO|nr:unnamed protein product [Clonostachys solani]
MATAITAPLSGLQSLLLNPLLTGSCLGFIKYGQREHVERLFELITKYGGITRRSTVKSAIGILFLVGLAKSFHNSLSRAAYNNWTLLPTMKNKWGDWSKEIAVVTGGCGGIGREIVLGLVAKGVTVVILDEQDLPRDLAANRKIKWWRCDVRNPEAVKGAADEIRLSLGHPSILIQNAGVAGYCSLLDTRPEFVRHVYEINVLSLWNTTKEFLPAMLRNNKGHIVTRSSGASYVALPNLIPYASSEAATTAFIEGLRQEIKHIYKSPGVLVTEVTPDWTKSSTSHHYSHLIAPTVESTDVSKAILSQIFSGRAGHVTCPSWFGSLSIIRGLPIWLQEITRDVMGRSVPLTAKRIEKPR